jgi:hypothetical protein
LVPRPPADHSSEPGYREWHAPLYGRCAICARPGPLERHHVVTEAHVRIAGGDPWALSNSLELGRYCACHRSHHQATRRLALAKVPDAAVRFAVALLGEERAEDYLKRHYR